MCDETPEERQNNEMAALEAIYGDAVVDNREAIAWKVWRPLDLMLTLHPLHNSDVQGIHCSVTLHFKCCTAYPDKPPSIAIHKMYGLSDDNATKLLSELVNLSQELCGEVMIFQLATHAQQFLHDHNKPTLSFYEEMVQQKTEKEKLKLHDMQVKENEERQKIKDEIQRRQEILRCAGRQRIHRSSLSQDNSNDGQGDAPELVFYSDDKMSPAKKAVRTRKEVPCTCSSKGAQVLRITQRNNRKVYIGNCLGHSSNGSITYLAIDDETGDRLIAKKWSLPAATDFQTRNRQLTSLHQDFKSICRLKHSSLIPYVAMETCKEPTKRIVKQCIYVFRNFILGSSLKYVKSRVFNFSDKFEVLSFLRHVALGVFSALKELHSEDVLHRDLRSENVFLDEKGGVKLVGAALDSRLTEMFEEENYCDRHTKSQDIFAAAQVLLSIVSQDRSVHEVPPELPGAAKDFFSKCLTEDEHTQWSAEQLVNHGFLVDMPTKVPNGKQKDDGGSGSEDEDPMKKIPSTTPPTNLHSRLNAEFEVLTWLGKGAFGDVLKVKNKLDGGFYAIKRVQLNPENVQLNKKITREVKLLSRLNHENVVRYYNAWIESIIDNSEEDGARSVEVVVKSPTKKRASLEDVVAKLGQEVKVEWSMSEGPVQQRASSDSEDEEDDDPIPWFNIMSPEDEESSSIEFETDSNQSQTIPSEDVVDFPRPPSQRLKKVLYIQMEFCEKHTLRQAIDNGLYQENFRAWRLFREIVEGLAHVHQRGMIHRDLKPVNIFLDSNDHVKIGDFGLATRAFTALPVDEKQKPEEIGGSLTGQVGTALYVAPELLQSASKVIYNQKVDIYSLGIILFEMFHPPLSTGMERMMVLTNLRTKEIQMPKAFEREENAKQISVIRWLLSHDASSRPTCAELLCSERVPRPVPEGALSALLQHTLSDKNSRGYQRLVAACLDQRQSPAEDLTYHNGMKTRPLETLMAIKDIVIRVFRSHGATEFSPPLLIPRAKGWDQYPNAVKVMTSSGTVCHLPHDLRLPFARHTAYTGTKYMRRYIVDRVYREKHVKGFHPREMIECAFDIVSPKTGELSQDCLWYDAELLVVASRAAQESSLKVSIQLNHTDLVRTLLLSCGVSLDKHADIYPVLVDVSFGRITSLQLQTHLTSLCVTNRDVSNLLKLMEADVPVYDVKDLVAQCPVTVAPFLAYNATQHSGVFWQMSVALDHKPNAKHRAGDVIAAGGRYDALVSEFWKVARAEKDQDELKSSSVGFSMSLERMAAILKKMEADVPPVVQTPESTLICLCVWGTAGSGRDGLAAAKRAQLAKDLWANGFSCCPFSGNSGEAHEMSRAGIVLKQDDAFVLVARWMGDRLNKPAEEVSDADRERTKRIVYASLYGAGPRRLMDILAVPYDQALAVSASFNIREHRIPYIDVLDSIKQWLSPDTIRSSEASGSTNRSISWSEAEKSSSGPNISVTFITASDRMTKNSKRHCENQINTQITSLLVSLGLSPLLSRCRVHVVALALGAAAVRALAASLDTRTLQLQGDKFDKEDEDIIEEAVKELRNLAKQSSQTRSAEETQLYALYSIPDSLCRLIT